MTGVDEVDREALEDGEYLELDSGNATVHVTVSRETTVVCVCPDSGGQESVVVEGGDVATRRSM